MHSSLQQTKNYVRAREYSRRYQAITTGITLTEFMSKHSAKKVQGKLLLFFPLFFLAEFLQIANNQSHCIPLILQLRSCIYSFSSSIISCMVGLALGSLCRHRRTRPRNAPFVTSTNCSPRL